MEEEQVRTALDALIRERGQDYAALSRVLGRNPAYIQQFIKRGTPRRLAEGDRRVIARWFGIDEAVLGGPTRPAEMARVPRLDVYAAAGEGARNDHDQRRGTRTIAPERLRELGLDAERAAFITAVGDSMEPTIGNGDELLVESGAAIRPGIYVLRLEGELLVKRLALQGKKLVARSDNPEAPELAPDLLDRALIVGRVVALERRL